MVAALASGRALIVPDSHRAAAVRLAWSRLQLAAGRSVWPSPHVLTWDAWLVRQWRAAVLRGAAPALQLLGAAQERELWLQVLQEMESGGIALGPHAPALMRAAVRAAQSQLSLPRSALSEEERLLANALAEVRRRCAARGWVSLKLASVESLQFLRDVVAPAIVGEPRLAALQEALQAAFWNDSPLLLAADTAPGEPPTLRLLRFPGLDQELSACAQWCRRRLQADGSARLLVLTACTQPSLAIQGEMLWRELSEGAGTDAQRNSMLAVEGGTPLHQLGLVADALAALGCIAPEVDAPVLLALLQSPYLEFGSQLERWRLQGHLEKWGMARWPMPALRAALDGIAAREPAAAQLRDWLQVMDRMAGGGTQPAGEWARRFSEGLAAAGFHRGQALDSREQQRLERWSQLLDEFAGLDAVIAPMEAPVALRRLRQLAAESRHQPASGDAAITLSAALHDPVVQYDGIWVMGLAETRWPAPPRPDAYVPLADQRRHHWPECSVSERRAQAQWAMSRWQVRTGELVLSHPAMEGDLAHRPTSVLPPLAGAWEEGPVVVTAAAHGYSRPFADQQFPPLPAAALEKALAGGVERLRIQRDCAFRAQAQWRLKAMPPQPLSDGLTAPARGTLLHRLLEGVWGELRDQSGLLSLDAAAEARLLQKHWNEATSGDAIAGARWWPAGLRERERARTFAILSEVLQLERARAPFSVQARELMLQWPEQGARLNLRIDRVDAAADGTRVLLDYKSGAAGRVKLHEGELEPLQLALYVAALAARGESVGAAALFSLKPGEVGISGVAMPGVALPGVKPLEDWTTAGAQWQRELLELLTAHIEGSGTLAVDPATCRHCHLSALCRRAALEDIEEGADE